jgi:hypothetical protein
MPTRAREQRLVELSQRIERVEALTAKQGRELEIQFRRMAQMQAELDERRTATDNVKLFIEAFPTKTD